MFRAAIYKGEITPVFPYKTVTIGTQTWMAENLNEDDGGEGVQTKTNVTAGDVTFDVCRFYSLTAAKRIAAKYPGWHIPSVSEWQTLFSYIGSNPGYKLKATTSWIFNGNGSDEYGFCLYGLREGSYAQGQTTQVWTSYESGSTRGVYEFIYYSNSYVDKSTAWEDNWPASVRLIKDAT